jgi:hypothetical protein
MQKLTVTALKVLTAKGLILQFPFGTLLLINSQAQVPKKKSIKKDFEIIRVTEKSWEFLGNSNGNWLEKAKEKFSAYKGMSDSVILESIYGETSVYDEYSQGCITVRLFYKEDKKLLKNWKFISPKLERYLAKIN